MNHSAFETRVLHSARLTLEPLRAAHAPLMFAGLVHSDGYDFIPERPPPSEAQLAARYAFLEGRRSPDGQEAWLN